MDLSESLGEININSDSNHSVDSSSVPNVKLSNNSVGTGKKVNFALDSDSDEVKPAEFRSSPDKSVSLKCVNGEVDANVVESLSESNNKDNEKESTSSVCSNGTRVEGKSNESISGISNVPCESPSGSGLEDIFDSFDSNGSKKRHIFILSSAGKPVYTRYGSEDKLVTLFGVMQALVSVVQDSDDTLQTIKCGKTCIAFLSEGPIILVGVSHSNDSLAYMKKKLSYINSQIVSILTLTQLTKIFEERHNYDLRRLLSGSERIIEHLLTFIETSPEFLLDSISCLHMPQSARDTISNTIVSSCSKIKNVVFGILIGNNSIISLVSLKKYKLEPCDIHLICNLVSSSESFKTAESWTPICLPKFNPSGYLHAHVSYLSDCPACLLLLTVEKDSFFELSEAKRKIEEKLIQNQSIIILKTALSQKNHPSTKTIDLPLVRHFIYKSCVNSQLLSSEVIEPYETEEKWQELLAKYEQLHSCMRNPVQPLGVLYQQLPNEVMLGWITNKFQLFAVFEPLVQKSDCNNAVSKILQWVIKEEEKLFMLNYLYFN